MDNLTIEELKKIRDAALAAFDAAYEASEGAYAAGDAEAAYDVYEDACDAYEAALNKKEGPKIVIERWFNVVQSPDYGLYIEQYSTKDAAIAARQVHGDTIITKAIPFVWREP